MNFFDLLTLGILLGEVLVYLLTPIPKAIFIAQFLFWRLSYNLGLGWLLKYQSEHNWLVQLTQPWLDAGRSPRRSLFLRTQFEKKLGSSYVFEVGGKYAVFFFTSGI
jgi:phosphatidylethanolamine N-methyltransferase